MLYDFGVVGKKVEVMSGVGIVRKQPFRPAFLGE
ncbi:hypothetical protein BH11ARM2_BH11ARM2_22060 [soil metagenome]